MMKKTAVTVLVVLLIASLGLNVFLAYEYFMMADLSAGMGRQYLHETESDIETLTEMQRLIPRGATQALAAVQEAIQTHSNRLDVAHFGEAYRE